MKGSLYIPTATKRETSLRSIRDVLYGRERDETVVWTRASIRDYWVREWREKVRRDQDALVLAWGPAGSGKSTCVMDLARGVDPTFTSDTLASHYAFRPEHVPRLYTDVPRYGAGIIDEAVSSGLMATDTFTQDQKDLVELINLIRAKNVVLFILLPDPSDLAKAFRARRADYRIEVERESYDTAPIAHIGRRVRGRKYYLDDGRWLGFMDDSDANPFTWSEYRESSDVQERALWDTYYPLKMRYLDDRVGAIRMRMEERARKREKRNGSS